MPETLEAEFRRVSVDQQTDDFMRSAKNAYDFRTQRLMVPSIEELEYRAGTRPPTIGTPRPEVVPYQPTTPYRQVSQTPTPYQPTSVDRLSRPSGGSPPPTPPTSGMGARTAMIEPPTTAAPRAPTTPTNPTPGARPSGLPIPAGGFSPPVVSAVADYGFRIVTGQPASRAAVAAGGNFAGTIVGSYFGGPAGGMVGGFAGGQLADYIYQQLAPKSAEVPTAPKVRNYFLGGQDPGRRYELTYMIRNAHTDSTAPNGVASDGALSTQVFYGPVEKVQEIYKPKKVVISGQEYIEVQYLFEVHARTSSNQPTIIGGSTSYYEHHRKGYIPYVDNLKITPETSGYPSPSPSPQDKRSPDSTRHPGDREATPPSASPAAGASPAPTNYIPGGTASRSNGTPRGDSPTWVPHGGPAGSPHPVNMPHPLVTPLPISTPAPGATPVEPNEGDRAYPAASPTGSPASITAPSPNAGNFSSPTSQGGPAILKFPSAAPVTTRPEPTPDALQPTPRPTTLPGTGTGTPDKEPSDEKLNDDIKDLGLKLAALTLLIKGLEKPVETIANNTSAPALEAAVCRPTQPGGCSSNLVNNAVDRGNNDLKDFIRNNGLDTAAQLEQLRLLNQLDSKMGAQIPGGISGFLQKFAKSIHLDKVINALTLITTLHNAAMLSRNLGSTLGEVTSQALSVIGIKDEDDNPIDINKQISQQVNELLEKALGADTWKGIKTTWNKANSVISSATNIMNTMRGLWDSSREVLEWTAENTGRIGNALKRFRVVDENAYRHMPEQVTHTNAWSLKVNRFREGTDSLDDAASSLSSVLGEVQNIQSEGKELKEQKERFDKNLAELTPKPTVDNKPVADAVAASKAVSKAPVDVADVFRGEGAEDDA